MWALHRERIRVKKGTAPVRLFHTLLKKKKYKKYLHMSSYIENVTSQNYDVESFFFLILKSMNSVRDREVLHSYVLL